MNKFLLKRAAALMLTICALAVSSCAAVTINPGGYNGAAAVSLDRIPEFSGSPYVEVNGNMPFFPDGDLTTESFEEYAELDYLGRCGAAYACLSTDTMPTEERGSIGMVKPSGWQTVRYDFVDGKYLYNRCHLIGYQLSGENANKLNLITGTRYMNVDGMLSFENETADYISRTGNHVLYRVTPVFDGENLLASGVLMEAKSVEDNGAGVSFCVYCYNVQPGVIIDYTDGSSRADGDTDNSTQYGDVKYILNTSSKKFHLPSCPSVADMNAANRKETSASRESLIKSGYAPCKSCSP